jgi:hypothetical protein
MKLTRARYLSIITIALILTGIGFLIRGGRQFTVYREFPSPKDMTIEDFLGSKPQEGWFRITDGAEPVDLGGWDEAANSGTSVLKDCWIPIIQRNDVPVTGNFHDANPAIRLIVHASDPRMVLTMSGIRYYTIKHDGVGLQTFRQQYSDDLVNYHSVTGVLRRPDADELIGTSGRTATDLVDYVMLEEGQRPGQDALVNLLGGFGILMLSVGFWVVQYMLWHAQPVRPFAENEGIGGRELGPRHIPLPAAPGDTIAMPVAEPPASPSSGRPSR